MTEDWIGRDTAVSSNHIFLTVLMQSLAYLTSPQKTTEHISYAISIKPGEDYIAAEYEHTVKQVSTLLKALLLTVNSMKETFGI